MRMMNQVLRQNIGKFLVVYFVNLVATGSLAYIRDYAAGPATGYAADSSAEATEPTA